MDSKLPLSSAPESADEFPRGVSFIKLSRYELLFICIFGGSATALCLALLAVLYTICRFFWALAFS